MSLNRLVIFDNYWSWKIMKTPWDLATSKDYKPSCDFKSTDNDI